MKWTKLSQRNLRSSLANDFLEALEKGIPENGKLGKVFIAPKTFAGSRKYYQKCYADLMTIIREFGKPTWYYLNLFN